MTPGRTTLPTSDAIRATSVDLFSQIGYAATSMRQIASAVGIKPASLYNHYASKEELLWEIVQEALSDILKGQEQAFAQNDDTVGKLRAFVRMHATFHAREANVARVVNSNLSGLSARHYKEAVADRATYERRLRDVLEIGEKEGVFSIQNTKVTSYAILEMGMGISIWYRPDGTFPLEQLADAHEQLALRMVGYSAV
jgi:AcrR family transcriptional regulator